MKIIIRNILAVIIGWIGGSTVNMGLIMLGHKTFPINGIDHNDMEAFAAIMPDLEPKYFLFPFLAHALGTFIGATIAAIIAASHKMTFSLVIGGLFLIGGIMINYMLPGPLWFTVADIVIAYIPMAWFGRNIAKKIQI